MVLLLLKNREKIFESGVYNDVPGKQVGSLEQIY